MLWWGTHKLIHTTDNSDLQNPVAVYLRQWEIECLFAALKSHGFCFEETHITDPGRIEKLMTLLAIGFSWAHRVGEWRSETKKPIVMKKHKDKTLRPQYTFFRYGLDLIREIILNIEQKFDQLCQCVNLLNFNLIPIGGGL